MEGTSQEAAAPVPEEPIRGHAPGLVGVSGRVLVRAGGEALGVLAVDDGDVEFIPGEGEADATLLVGDREDLALILRGQLNPLVAALQDRLEAEGDLALAVEVILGLEAGSPFTGARLPRGA
jgi:hypothetical protein